MMILKLIFALLFPTALGYMLIVSISSKNDGFMPLEKLGLSYGIGTGILTFIMFLIGAFKCPIDLSSIFVACAVLFAYPLFITIRKIDFPKLFAGSINIKDVKWYEWVLIFFVSARVLYSFFSSVVKPVEDVDAFANWSLRAKVFFFQHSLSLDKVHGYFLGGGGHIDYPINIPLLQAWIYNVLGTWNDLLAKAIFPTFLLALVAVFYCSMRKVSGRAFSLFSTYLLTTLPFLIYHSSSSYMDFPLCFYFFASFACLLTYMRSGSKPHLIVSALLAGICAWTKNEGLILALVIIICAFGYLAYIDKNDIKRKVKLSALYAAMLALIPVAWQIFKVIYKVPSPPDQVLYFSKMFEYGGRIPVIITSCFQKAFLYGHWNIAWFMFFAVLVFSLIKRKAAVEGLFVIGAIFLCIGGYGIEYYLSKSYEFILEGTTLNRNFLTFMPLVIYYICSNMPHISGKIERK